MALTAAVAADRLLPSPRGGWRGLDEIIAGAIGSGYEDIPQGRLGPLFEDFLAGLAGLTAEGLIEHCPLRNGWEWWRVREGFG